MLKGDSKIMEIRLLTESDVRENTESLRCHLENCIVSTYEIENIRDFTEKKINDLLQSTEDGKPGLAGVFPVKHVEGCTLILSAEYIIPV